MPCRMIRTPGGGLIMACGPRRQPPRCTVCRARPGVRLCDGLQGEGAGSQREQASSFVPAHV
jgi:hypothetical protein